MLDTDRKPLHQNVMLIDYEADRDVYLSVYIMYNAAGVRLRSFLLLEKRKMKCAQISLKA